MRSRPKNKPGALAENVALGRTRNKRPPRTPSASSKRDSLVRAAERFLDEHRCPDLAREATGVPGVAIAVAFSDGPPVLRAYGVRDLAAKQPVDENTVFALASVSKPITSTIVAALVGDGVLGWDDLVSKHVPSFLLRAPGTETPPRPAKQTVTVADLLAHCSGLPDHAGDVLEDIGYDRNEVFGRLASLPCGPRKTEERYTNFGFTAAAVAAATAYSKQRRNKRAAWEDVAKERLYQRLGMTRTSSRYHDFDGDPNCAAGHQRFARYPGQWEWVAPAEPRIPDAQSPAGGVRSCAADMAKWMQLQLNKGTFEGQRVVDEAALAATHTAYFKKSGLGWNVSPSGDVSHSGAFVKGAATCVVISKALGVGIAVLTNGEPIGVPEATCYALMDYLLGKDLPDGQTMRSWLVKAEQLMRSALPPPPDRGYATWVSDPPRDLAQYRGTYKHPYFGDIELDVDEPGKGGGTRRLKLFLGPHRREVALQRWNRDTFVYQTFGENAVGLDAVEFDFSKPRRPRVCVRNLRYSATNPAYCEIDAEAKELAWFTR